VRESSWEEEGKRLSSRFVFLDRDGTLIHDVGYGHRPEDYELIEGVPQALVDLCAAGFRLVIVTNQSGIARGLYGREDFDRFHQILLDDLERAGIEIAATYMCPHLPDEGCTCRKPKPTSLFQARDRFGIDLTSSWVIGDHVSDVSLAANAGSRGILVLTGHGEEERERLGTTPVDAIVPDLPAAVRHILERS
jgi:D-glycero-D-manno-heptose 1,7-bisphosphate phosphatase